MLQIVDKNGKVTMLWRDEDDEPVSVDELILRERTTTKPEEKDNASEQPKPVEP